MSRFTPHVLTSAVALAAASTALAQDTQQLNDIVVTAAGYEQSLRNAPASISVVTREELQQMQFANVAEAIANVPGVDVREGTGKTGGYNISIRGMPSDYTLILIDGRRQNTSGSVTPNGFGSTSTSFMPPVSQIERIEVIRGPMSTLYGSDAMGGVVNIITRRIADDWAGTVTVENTFQQDRGIGNSSAINLYAAGPVIENKLGAQVRGRLYDRDSSDRMIENSLGRDPRQPEARIYSIGGRLNFTPDEANELWVDAERSRQSYSNDNCRLGSKDGLSRSDCATPDDDAFWGYEDELHFNRDQIAIGHTGHFTAGTLESSITHNTTETLGRTLPAGSAPSYGYEAQGGEKRLLENRDLVVDTKFVAPLGDHMLTIGGQYIDAELEDGAAGSETFKQSSWALFAEDEWLLTDTLALTVGGRYEHHKAFGGHFSPRGYLNWSPDDNWTLKGGVSRGYKTPTLNQLHDGITGFSGQGTVANIGSPDLEPEKSTNYELGAIYDSLDGFSAGATLFYNKFTDRIDSANPLLNCQYIDNAGDTPYANSASCLSIGNFTAQESFGQLVNIGKAETRGLELTANYQFNPAWSINGGYTYTDSEIKSGENKGQLLTNTPEHKLTAELSWDINDRWNTTLEGEYYSSRERISGGVTPGTQEASLVDQIGNKLEGYEIFNLRTSYRFANNVRLTATIYNLFDKDFSDYDTYTHDGDTYVTYRYIEGGRSISGVALDSRSLWLSAGYEF